MWGHYKIFKYIFVLLLLVIIIGIATYWKLNKDRNIEKIKEIDNIKEPNKKCYMKYVNFIMNDKRDYIIKTAIEELTSLIYDKDEFIDILYELKKVYKDFSHKYKDDPYKRKNIIYMKEMLKNLEKRYQRTIK